MSWEVSVFGNSESDLVQWREYYKAIDIKAIYHSPDYIKSIEEHFKSKAELFVFGDKNSFVYYPYLKMGLSDLESSLNDDTLPFDKLYDISSSWYYGGALVKNEVNGLIESFRERFNEYAFQSGIVTEFIRLDANLKNHQYYDSTDVVYNRETVFVDLRQSNEEIWQDLSGSNRRAIKKASNSGLEVKVVKPDETGYWKEFHKIYTSEMHRKEAPLHLYFDFCFFEGLFKRIPENIILLVAEKDGEFGGGFIIVYDESSAFHFLSATNPEYWPLRVNNLLFFEAILLAKKKGCWLFDFMGGRDGVFRFKSNFSSTRNRFYTFNKIHKIEEYNRLAELKAEQMNQPDMDKITFFPPYRA